MNEDLKVFDELESEVRSYCRLFPTVFSWAKGSKLKDIHGKEYIDFFSGAGGLNYGHNHPAMKKKLLEYIASDGIMHGLDMATEAKKAFLTKFNEIILKPRGMQYKIMFPGPTGTNSVESALKLARKIKGRDTIISFTNAFHGMTLGSLSITGNEQKRQGAGIPLNNSIFMPFDQYFGEDINTVEIIRKYLEDTSSGASMPAAMILETVQGEGGLNTASKEWLQQIEALCREKDILLIVDDIQAGCGRTGTFFSFEPAGIKPDIICLSKSISGSGLPMALTLINPELDIWLPGEHNGTFRGNNLAFVTATEALNFWKNRDFVEGIASKAKIVTDFLTEIIEEYPEIKGKLKGRGLMQGIACGAEGMAKKICSIAFQRGLILETAGPNDEVIKLFPALTIDDADLVKGLTILRDSIEEFKQQTFNSQVYSQMGSKREEKVACLDQ